MEYCTEAEALAEMTDGLYRHQSQSQEDLEIKVLVMTSRYEVAKNANVGQKIPCGCCGKQFVKKSYQQAFCRNKGKGNCKDKYWNTTNDARRERALQWC